MNLVGELTLRNKARSRPVNRLEHQPDLLVAQERPYPPAPHEACKLVPVAVAVSILVKTVVKYLTHCQLRAEATAEPEEFSCAWQSHVDPTSSAEHLWQRAIN